MKPSFLQTPRVSYRGRSKRSESTSGDGKVPKIAGKGLSFDSPPDSIEWTPNHADLLVSSPESSVVDDPTPEKDVISSLSLSPREDDTETGGSGEIAGGLPCIVFEDEEEEKVRVPADATSSAMVPVPVVSASEDELKSAPMIDQVRQALAEMRSSADVSDGSKRLLDVLVETAISGGSSRGKIDRVGSLLSRKILVIAVFLLVGWVAAANFLVLSIVYHGFGDTQVSFTYSPPT